MYYLGNVNHNGMAMHLTRSDGRVLMLYIQCNGWDSWW